MGLTELMFLITLIFLLVFAGGWFARVFFDRLDTSKPLASEDAMKRLNYAEDALRLREEEFHATESQYASAYAQLEAELEAAMSGLGDARRELAHYKKLQRE